MTGADLSRFLSDLAKIDIPIKNISYINEISISAFVPRQNMKQIYKKANRFGIHIKKNEKTFADLIKYLLNKRAVILLSFAMLLILTLYLPTRILIIEIEGNTTIPSKFIIETAESCGISFGANRKTVRSEIIKNKLLSLLPDLQWAGINTYGCRAVISVKEKIQTEKDKPRHEICNIIAATDGIVESVTVTSGNNMCAVGQAVKKGQMLVSAYTNVGKVIKISNVEAEIYAKTKHDIALLTPLSSKSKKELKHNNKKTSLIIGKLRIKLYNDTGISSSSCDKIYEEYNLTLPGGYKLPVRLAVETENAYTMVENSHISDMYLPNIAKIAERFVINTMISGKILNRSESSQYADECIIFTGRYDCIEMIARNHTEEISNE